MTINSNGKWFGFLGACGLVLMVGGCGLAAGTVDGQVLEEGTNRPIAGATVVAQWIGQVPVFVDSQRACVQVDTATTDAEGKYRFSGWVRAPGSAPLVTGLHVQREAYKVGFEYSANLSQDEKIIYMAKMSSTPAQRIEFLANLSKLIDCNENDKDKPGLLALHRQIYQEAKDQQIYREAKERLRSMRDLVLVESTLYDLEKLEFGFEAAEKRHLGRVGN